MDPTQFRSQVLDYHRVPVPCIGVEQLSLVVEGLFLLFLDGAEIRQYVHHVPLEDQILVFLVAEVTLHEGQTHVQILFLLVFAFDDLQSLAVGVVECIPLKPFVLVLPYHFIQTGPHYLDLLALSPHRVEIMLLLLLQTGPHQVYIIHLRAIGLLGLL